MIPVRNFRFRSGNMSLFCETTCMAFTFDLPCIRMSVGKLPASSLLIEFGITLAFQIYRAMRREGRRILGPHGCFSSAGPIGSDNRRHLSSYYSGPCPCVPMSNKSSLFLRPLALRNYCTMRCYSIFLASSTVLS